MPITTESIDFELKKSEIKDKLQKAKREESQLIIDKISVLEELLSSSKPGQKDFPGAESFWVPSITNERNIAIIERKIMELIAQL